MEAPARSMGHGEDIILKTRHWDRIGNGGLTFTEIGFGTAPLGNLYRAISDEMFRRHPGAATKP